MRRYKIQLSHKMSKVYVKVYGMLQKVGASSPGIDAMLEHGGLKYQVRDRVMEGYKFRDIEVTVAKLYEYRDAKKIGKSIKKFMRHHGGENVTMQYSRVNDAFEKQILSGDYEQYHANLGSLKLDQDKSFTNVAFEIEVINRAYFMFYATFSLEDSTSKQLEDARLQEVNEGSIGLNFMPFVKRLRFSLSFKHKYEQLYDKVLDETMKLAAKSLKGYMPSSLVTTYGITTLYQTKASSKEVVDAFRKNRVGFSPIYSRSEKLYIESRGEFNYLQDFIKVSNIDVMPGTKEYPNEFVADFGMIFFYQTFELFIINLKSDVNKIILNLSRSASLKTLSKQSNQLAVQRYHLANIQNLLSGPAWKRFIRWKKSEGVALARLNRRRGKSFDYSKEVEEMLMSTLHASQQLVENAATKVKSELNIKNTSSNNWLSRVVLCVTALALAVALGTVFVTLYPKSTRAWLCDRKLFCSSLIEDK